MVRAVDSEGQNDFASIFASVAQEKREKEEKHQTALFMQVLDEMEATPEPRPCSSRASPHERQQGYDDEGYDDDFEEFKAFRAFRRQQARTRHSPQPARKEYLRVDEDEEDETRRVWRQSQAKAKRERAEKVSKVHTLDDLPRDNYDFFLGGQPLLDETPELTIDEGRRLGDGERVYTASFPGLFENIEVGVWVFRVELLLLLAAVVLLIGIYLGRRTMQAIRAQASKPTHPEPSTAQPQIIYAFPPPGMFSNTTMAPPQPPVAQGV